PYVPFIRMHARHAIISMRAHNVEHEIWDRIAAHTSFTPKKWYIKHLSEKLKDYEISRINSYDLLVSITEKDRQLFRQLGRKGETINIPIGLDSKGYTAKSNSDTSPLSISFIGSLDWMPNIEGLSWFLESIWPVLTPVFPSLELHIAGRNCPDWLNNLGLRNVIVHGEVADSRDFLLQHPISIVPLRSGSGMRAKILEAMALGRVVITTTIGLEGILAQHQENLLVADDAKDFLACLRFCFQNESICQKISQNARLFIETHFDHIAVAQQYRLSLQQLFGTLKTES
nr:glycosyltransferase family 4 protein [Saprospiraceae bacterium]